MMNYNYHFINILLLIKLLLFLRNNSIENNIVPQYYSVTSFLIDKNNLPSYFWKFQKKIVYMSINAHVSIYSRNFQVFLDFILKTESHGMFNFKFRLLLINADKINAIWLWIYYLNVKRTIKCQPDTTYFTNTLSKVGGLFPRFCCSWKMSEKGFSKF